MNQYELAVKNATENRVTVDGKLNLYTPGYVTPDGKVLHNLPIEGTVFLTYSRQFNNVVTSVYFDWEEGDYFIEYTGITASGKWVELGDYWFTGTVFKEWSTRLREDYRGL